MAVAFHGFSIREYALKMRSVDVLKCYPYDVKEGKIDVEAMLPPITVTKFRWWSDELEASRSNGVLRDDGESVEKTEELVGVEEEKLETDSCAAQARREERRKAKSKAPKKRSIAEIFAVAPQIVSVDSEVVDFEEEEEEEKEEEENLDYVNEKNLITRIKSKKNYAKKKNVKKKKKQTKMEVDYRAAALKNVKKMKKKKKKKNKENAHKLKMQTAVTSAARKLKGPFCNKRFLVDVVDVINVHKKKSSLKFLSRQKKPKIKKCGSVTKPQKPLFPVRGILKNHAKHISERTSAVWNIQDGTGPSHSDIQLQTLDRHVRFSDKDDIFGPEKRNSYFENGMFNLFPDALATSSGKEQSTGSDKEAVDVELNKSDGHIVIHIDKGNAVHPITENKQFPNACEQVTMQNFLRPNTNQEKPVSLSQVADINNLHIFDKGSTATLHCPPYTGTARSLSALQGAHSSCRNSLTGGIVSGALSPIGEFIDHPVDPTCQATAINSQSYTREFLRPSSSSSAFCPNENGRHPFQSQFYADWRKGTDGSRNHCRDENFFGLPLNSHGELIRFSSSGKGTVNQLQESSVALVSSSRLPVNNLASPSNQDYYATRARHLVEKSLPEDQISPSLYYPARLGVRELQSSENVHWPNSERGCDHYVCPPDSVSDLIDNSFIEHSQHDQVQNRRENGMIHMNNSDHISLSSSQSQPTMRLMGKDVAIGRSSKEMQQFVDRKDWAGEESRRNNYAMDTVVDNVNRYSKQDLILNPPAQIPNRNLSQNSGFGLSRARSSCMHPFAYSPTSCAGFSRETDLLELYKYRAEPLGLSCPLQVLPTCNTSQHACFSTGNVRNMKNLPFVTNSIFEFPFLHPDFGEQIRPSCFQRSPRGLPPWLLSATQHEKPPAAVSSQYFSGVGGKGLPHNIWESNFRTTPSVHHSQEVLFPPNTMMPGHLHMKSPLDSVVHSPLAPVIPGFNPTSSSKMGSRNEITVADRMKSNVIATRDHHPYKITKKRPPTGLDNLMKATKIPNLGLQGLSGPMGLTREKLSGQLQSNTGVADLDPNVNNVNCRGCCQDETPNVRLTAYPGIDSSIHDCAAKSGPIKLSPGAKHILKPCQNMDQDNSRSVHSAIPVAATTDSSRDLEIQKRSTKIYRF
ncbi:Inter-alpha-trypsin inhibitor heavy chain like [Quillaja saponaria]|uniref:Inter-alpha-trypsin inhibitor heavy chain like n=1 Tax=Quillaja saponaria TaxID=32244 RepID=A0AAD7PQ95_QUISA|nr:Inter-alpha-trypsin inhibitor heavy chain like [Quillaja saponaria]